MSEQTQEIQEVPVKSTGRAKVHPNKRWKKFEVNYLKDVTKQTGFKKAIPVLVKALNRTDQSIIAKARRLGLSKVEEVIKPSVFARVKSYIKSKILG